VAASLEPGSSVSVVARRYDVNANQVFAWRKHYRVEASAPAALRLVPVRVTPDRPIDPAPASERIEIELPNGCRIRVDAAIDSKALRRILDILERR
jgi:transposase